MLHKGSCHCGKITFEVKTDLEQVIACNCSHCSRKGYLLNFVPREALKITQGQDDLSTYTFNRHTIRHRFCPTCGCAPFADGRTPKTGQEMAAVNVRCLEGIEIGDLKPVQVDGRSF